jgi:hypothetical protein
MKKPARSGFDGVPVGRYSGCELQGENMTLFWAAFFKPFFALIFAAIAWLIAKALYKLIPEGKIKRALYSPLPWFRDRKQRRWG